MSLAQAKSLPTLRATAERSYLALVPDIVEALSEVADADDLRRELMKAMPNAGIEPLVQHAIPFLMANESALPDRIASIELTLLNDMQRVIDDASRAPEASRGKDDVLDASARHALLDFLRGRFGQEQNLEIGGVSRIVGGYSKETLIVELRNNAALPAAIVIRHDKHAVKNGERGLAEEWLVLNTLYDAGVAVPQPLALEAEGKVLKGPFLVTAKVEGRNIGDTFDAYGGSAALALDLAATLAKIHKLPATRFGDGIAGATTDNRTRMRDLVEQFEAEWRSWNRPGTLLETSFCWLKRNIGVIGSRRALVHGDIGFHNFLARDDRVAALLDWEIASIGNPAQDLGYAYHSVVRLVDWPRFVEAYADAGATPPSQAEIDFYSIWASVWRTTISLRCRLAFEAGHLAGPQFTYPSAYLLQRELRMLAEKMQLVLSSGTTITRMAASAVPEDENARKAN